LKVIGTADGSKTLYSERFAEHYHSVFGAANESEHVFIEAGYLSFRFQVSSSKFQESVSVLEIGFGTGLNAWLTLRQANRMPLSTYYEAVECYPIEESTACELSDDELFRSLHAAAWEQAVEITPHFTLRKRKCNLLQALQSSIFSRSFDVVYFDAFSPGAQPEMWSRDVFSFLHAAMNPGGVLTTYCAKGEVRRIMKGVGFSVERLPGPAGKREMLRSRKAGNA